MLIMKFVILLCGSEPWGVNRRFHGNITRLTKLTLQAHAGRCVFAEWR